MAQHLAVGVYETLGEAEAAVRSLGGGFPFALLGGTEQAMVGPITGILGLLYHLGLFKEDAERYEMAVKAGKFLVIVHGSPEAVKKGHDVLAKSQTGQVKLSAPMTA